MVYKELFIGSLLFLAAALAKRKSIRDLPVECVDFNEINDETRVFDNFNLPSSGDNDLRLKHGWYRFLGSSGNSLKVGYNKVLKPSQTAPNFCSTEYAGTLMGSHPTVEEGMVEMTVCFRARNCFKTNTDCACERRKVIYVRNCLKHYIYWLSPTNSKERYCSGRISMQSDPKNTSTITECSQYRPMPGGEVASTRLWNEVSSVDCDKQLHGWYRFTTGGKELASECIENDERKATSLYGQPCGATFRGWMPDPHPSVSEGRVQRRICFSYDRKCQCEFYSNIAVRNCGSFYVYRMDNVPVCEARYCSAPVGKTSKVTDGKKPPVTIPKDLCKDYSILYDPDRLWSYTSPTVVKCDAGLYGKYRFGSEYTPWTIKEGCNRSDSNIVTHRCGSTFHGYMNGEHPTESEGYIERVICFQDSKRPCECKHTTTVGVQNCGGYYVYYFKGVPACSSRFCMVANKSSEITIDPVLQPLYKIPPPNYTPVTAKVTDDDGGDGNGGLIATTTALSIIILIVIIILIILILLLILKVYPMYKENEQRKHSRPVSVASSTHLVFEVKEEQPPKQSTSNGDLPKYQDVESTPIAPYPSDLPPEDESKATAPNLTLEDDNDSVVEMQRGPGSDDDLHAIPEDLEMNEDGDDDDDNSGDCDTLLKNEDMFKPKSYEHLPAKDSAV